MYLVKMSRTLNHEALLLEFLLTPLVLLLQCGFFIGPCNFLQRQSTSFISHRCPIPFHTYSFTGRASSITLTTSSKPSGINKK